VSAGHRARAPAPTVMDQCQGDSVHANAVLRATGQSQTETRRRCAEMGDEGIREVRPAISTSTNSWACSASVSCRARWCQGRGGVEAKAISEELIEAYHCAGGCRGRGAVQEDVRRPIRVRVRARASNCNRNSIIRGILSLVSWGLTVSGAFPSGSMVAETCSCMSFL
jgi:hypothetical protein